MPDQVEDISLDDLIKNESVSTRTINICRTNHLNTLNDIIKFYRENGTFQKLKNCGPKTQLELSEICKKFSNHSFDNVIISIWELNEIKTLVEEFSQEQIEATNKFIEYLMFKLSNRARNGLLRLFNGIPSPLILIERIYSSTFSFYLIKNIGDKTVKELEAFKHSLLIYLNEFKNSQNDILPTLFTDIEETFLNIFNNFNPFKKAALNRHIEYLISNLPIRARNGIIEFFGEKSSAKEIVETIYSYSFDFRNIKNIGSKTVSQLNNFKSDISNFISTLNYIENNKLNREYTKLIIRNTFTGLPANFYEQMENVFDNTAKIKVFKLIDLLIDYGKIFKLKEKEKEIFYYTYTKNQSKTLKQISIELDLSKERLRQIRKTFEYKIQDYFRFILNFNLEDLVSYNIPSGSSFKIIDDEFAERINNIEEVNFNVLFYSVIFGLLLENSYTVLGDNETISGKGNYSNTIHYKNSYLIQNSIFNSFNFSEFVEDIHIKLSERIAESYKLYFEGYLIQFLPEARKEYFPSIVGLCEMLLFNEFDLVVNSEGFLIFERNVRKPLVDYTLEILEELDQMTKVEDITKAINKKYPDLQITEQSVRSTLQREKNFFMFIGRTSTYGLKKWENLKKSLKGGTIRSLTEEYLKMTKEPKHIHDIASYILQFRPSTYERSVMDNLKADQSGKFIFLGKGLIGLKTFNYSSDFTGLKRILKDWNEYYNDLKHFRELNPNKWPSIASEQKSERLLYNFNYKNRIKYLKNELEEEKLNLLKEIGFLSYVKLVRSRSKSIDWYAQFENLKSFIKENNKLPSANSNYKKERALYRFLYFNKLKIKNNELDKDKQNLLIQLIFQK